MSDADVFKTITELVISLDEDKAMAAVQKALDEGYDPLEILQKGVIVGLRVIGDKFGSGEYFLPELMMGADLSEACTNKIMEKIPEQANASRGVVLLGAVQGDLHDIGKSLVLRQISLAGYKVHDLGINVPSMTFIDKARELNADIIGLSAFLDATRPFYAEVINYLNDMGLRNKYKVIIGGVAASAELAESIGADGWAPDAPSAVKLCDKIMGQ
ncbi:MAG: cobalamin-dependent protein [Proteobacteria bacterium]|nr:cobalamin-dependent protein [Pseudomonadota bacterium]